MAVYTKVEFKNLCRLCISYSDNNLDIFNVNFNSSDLKCKISDCLSIQINDHDPLPKKICNTCLEKLESFNEFRKICYNSESTLQCYYSLFKSTIDSDGTIFIKANGNELPKRNNEESDVVSTTTTNLVPVNYVEGSIIISNGTDLNAGAPSLTLLSGTSSVSTSTDPIIPLSAATENGIITTGCTVDGNLVESNTTIISGSSDPLVQPLATSFQFVNQLEHTTSNQVASVTNIMGMEERFQFADNKEDIVILDGNKCNILDFIDPSAQIYMVNVDAEGKLVAHQVQTDLSQEVGFSEESVLDQALSNPEPARDEPVLDQQGIENISEFLRSIYPNENSKILDKCQEDAGEGVSMTFLDDSDCDNGKVVNHVDMVATVTPSDDTKNFVELVALAPTPENILLNLPIQTSEDPVSEVAYDSIHQVEQDVDSSPDFNSPLIISNKISNTCNDGFNIDNSETDVKQVAHTSEPSIIERLNITDKPTMKISSDDMSSDQLSNSSSKTPLTQIKNKIKPNSKISKRSSKQKPIPDTEGNQCLICNKIFENRRKLKTHMNAHEEKIYQCPYCNKCYGRNWHRNRHIEKSHNPLEPLDKVEFICSVCSKEYSRKDNLRKHMLTHNQVYACEKCKAILETGASFKKHKATNCGVKETCDKCGAEFDSKTFHLQHINSNCGRDTVEESLKFKLPSFRCTLCDMIFSSRWRFKHHMELHKRVDPSKNNFLSGKVFLNPNDKARDQYITDKAKVSRIVSEKLYCSKDKNDPALDQSVTSSSFNLNKESSGLTKLSRANTESTNHPFEQNMGANETKNTSLPLINQKSVKNRSSQNVDVTFGQFIKDLLKRPSAHRKNIHALLDSIVTRKLGKSTDVNKTTTPEPQCSKDLKDCSQKFLENNKKENLKLETNNEISVSNSSTDNTELQEESAALNSDGSVILEPVKSSIDISSNKQFEKHKITSSLTEHHIDDFVLKLVQSLNDDSSLPTDDIASQSKKETKLLTTESSQRDQNLERKFLSTLEESYRKYRQMALEETQEVAVQEQTKDLVMKINDNLPDTLLTVLSNSEKSDVRSIDKLTFAAENGPNNFLEESVSTFECTLDNLLDAPDTSFAENDLENILKEAVETLGDCGPANFSDEQTISSIKGYDEALMGKSMDDLKKQLPKSAESSLEMSSNLEPLNDFHKNTQPQGESLNDLSITIISTHEEVGDKTSVEVESYETLVKNPLSILETSNAEVSPTFMTSSEGLIDTCSTGFESCETNSLILTKTDEDLSKHTILEKNSKVPTEVTLHCPNEHFSKNQSKDLKDLVEETPILDRDSKQLDEADVPPLMVLPYLPKDVISHFNSSFIGSTENISPINLVEKVSPEVKIVEGNLAGDASIVSNNKEMNNSTNLMINRKNISNKDSSHKVSPLITSPVTTSNAYGKDQEHLLENDLSQLSSKEDKIIVSKDMSIEAISLGIDDILVENSQLKMETNIVEYKYDDASDTKATSLMTDHKCHRTQSKDLDGTIEFSVETSDESIENTDLEESVECVSTVEGAFKDEQEEVKSNLDTEVIKNDILTNAESNYEPHSYLLCDQILSNKSQKMLSPVVRIARADLSSGTVTLDNEVVSKAKNISSGISFIAHNQRRKRSYYQDTSVTEDEKLIKTNYISNKPISIGNDEGKLTGFNGEDLENCVVLLPMVDPKLLHHSELAGEENDVQTVNICETPILKSPSGKTESKTKRKLACRLYDEDVTPVNRKCIKLSDCNKVGNLHSLKTEKDSLDPFLELKSCDEGSLKVQNIDNPSELNSDQPVNKLITLSDTKKLGVATNTIKLKEDLSENESICVTTNKRFPIIVNDKKKPKIKKAQLEYMKEFDIRECSIKIPQIGESMLYNNLHKMEETSEVINNSESPDKDSFTNTSSKVKDLSDEECPKESLRTIRILLERFDPQKMSQYSGKDQCKMSLSPACISQPYNLRKAKEVQTYICTMEDS